MRTLCITRTRVYETIRAQTRNRQAFQLVASSAASIPRTPSASNYIEMTPAEQQDIRFLYNLCLPNLKAKIVNVLKSTSGVYISDPSLRLAVLSCSAFEQANFNRSEGYLSKFWPATRRITRSNVKVDHIIAFTLMMCSVAASSSQEKYEHLQKIAKICCWYCRWLHRPRLFVQWY